MQGFRAVHRITMFIIVLFTLYLGCTGTVIQLIDLRSILAHAPATDPDLRAMREGFSGPPNFQVIRPSDYTAAPMPGLDDPAATLGRVLTTARQQLQDDPIDYLEMRMADGRPTAFIQSKKSLLAVDAASGRFLGTSGALPPEKAPPDALRNKMKIWHKYLQFGRWALAINFVVGIGLGTLVVTGLWIYWKVYAARHKMRRNSPFWSGGGFWRAFHRHVSLVASVFVLIVALSGTEITFETLYRVAYELNHPALTPSGKTEFVDGREGDKSAPLSDAELPQMWRTVMARYQADMPNVPVRAVRLRYFAGIPQGVVITGSDEAEQLVFNARTGQEMGQYEPGYPPTGFPFGWHIHQLAKNIHRGDLIGLPGRALSLITGLSLIYLSLSGIVMYWDMWTQRRRTGRHGLFWK